MTCDHVRLPGGGTAIVCSRSRRPRQKCKCGQPATLLCDWKVKARKSGTCDAPICATCAEEVGPDKHLCPDHLLAYAKWRAAREAK